ncbi:MAG: ATP-binding protein [Cyanobacteria bacterium P01_E01_bin.42]
MRNAVHDMKNQKMALAVAVEALRGRMEQMEIQQEKLSPIPIPPALEYLGNCFQLTRLEQETLLLCAAMELDDTVPMLCDRLEGGKNRPYPTFSLAFGIFGDEDWEVVSCEGALRYWHLLEVQKRDTLPDKWCPLKIDQRILNFLVGHQRLDRRLASLVYPLGTAEEGEHLPACSPSQEAVVKEICRVLEKSPPGQRLPIIQFLGENAPSKQQIARAVAENFGWLLLGLPGQIIPSVNAEYEDFLRLWERENHLLDLALYLDTEQVTAEAAVQRFASQCRGMLFLDGRSVRLPAYLDVLAVATDKPTPKEQRQAWATVLGEEVGEIPSRLASQFSLTFGEIEKIAVSTRDRQPRERSLWQACLQHSVPRLEGLAQRLEVKASLENLVLPERELGLLRQIVQQVRLRSRVYDEWGYRDRLNRGLGTSALFAGESGTGKTMAAEVIAKELDIHLYRIDLSSVVSKYIGETEKNLSRLFDAAEEGGAILFFDEADALFGKRSEVKDARDRYANIEVDYLLQRIESYRGLAILATNLKGSLDEAFLRRLRFIIDFPFPNPESRLHLWQKEFPPALPLGALDWQFLARFNLTGGAIHNIALNAAFLAAERGERVEMEHILAAARLEWQKLGRPIYEAEFQWDGTSASEGVYDFA